MKYAEKPRRFAFGWRAKARTVVFAARRLALVFALFALIASSCGCGMQLGETRAEARRRHIRNERIRGQLLKADADAILLTDKPSKLSQKRIP